MRQLQATTGTQPEDLVDKPFIKLDSGVSYREYREGTGNGGKKKHTYKRTKNDPFSYGSKNPVFPLIAAQRVYHFFSHTDILI